MIVRQDYIIYDLPLRSCKTNDDWEIKTIGELADVMGGGTPDTGVDAYWNPSEILWATPTEIKKCKGIFISDTERKISKPGMNDGPKNYIPAMSILLTSRATVGEARINTVDMTTNQGFASLVPKANVDLFFLFYLTYHLKPTLLRLAAGTTYLEISRREIRKIRCYIPREIEEQRIIGQTIKAVDDALLCSEDGALMNLKESLIQNLLTAKVRMPFGVVA